MAIADVVDALIAARKVEPGRHIEIASPDTLAFEEITEIVAEELGEKHRSGRTSRFRTRRSRRASRPPVVDADYEVLRPLMEGLESDLLVEATMRSRPVFGVEPTPFRKAAAAAIESIGELEE